jgi:muramoyltetrapeptide carboxypeptidase
MMAADPWSVGTLRRPPLLRPGMRIGIVAPSSPIRDGEVVEEGVGVIRAMGLEVVIGPHALDDTGHLAGSDRDRASDLVQMLTCADIDGVICLRGGWGALRTLLSVRAPDFERLRNTTPKVFVGFSDATVVHGLLHRMGWVTLYGPMISTLSQACGDTVTTLESSIMQGGRTLVEARPDQKRFTTIVGGITTGPLVGGCLQVLCLMTGSPWEFAYAGSVVLLEDVDSVLPDIESRLCHLLASGRLKQCSGIVIGECVRCSAGQASITLENLFRELLTPLGVPVLYGLPLGHGEELLTVPLGVEVRLDATNGQLEALHSAVV